MMRKRKISLGEYRARQGIEQDQASAGQEQEFEVPPSRKRRVPPLIDIKSVEGTNLPEPVIAQDAQRIHAPANAIELSQQGMRATFEEEPEVLYQPTSQIPQIEGFGAFDAQDRYVEYMEWIELVCAVLSFVPHWTEERKAAWFRMKCGDNLRQVMHAFEIKSTDPEQPFTSLVNEIGQCLFEQTDASVRHEAFMSVRQEPGEPAAAYYIRLKRAGRGLVIDPQLFRNRCIAGLGDSAIRDSAITNPWDERQAIAAATRKEGLAKRKDTPSANSVSAESLDILVASVVRKQRGEESRKPYGGPGRGGRQKGRRAGLPRTNNKGPASTACGMCGFGFHRNGKCPAIGKQCAACKEYGHFAAVCSKGRKNAQANEVSQEGFNF